MSPAIEARFWAKASPARGCGGECCGGSECLIWRGAMNSRGYGVFWPTPRRSVKAHRFAVKLSGRRLRKGQVVMHTCDTPLCVNPGHLRPVSQRRNVRDMLAKGRYPAERASTRRRLTENDVIDIRTLADQGATNSALARAWELSRQYVGQLVRRAAWKRTA